MNYSRLALAALGGTLAYFAFGFLVFTRPLLVDEYRKYPALYRSEESLKSVMPAGMASMFLAILVVAVIYAKAYPGESGVAQGAQFGALIGIFAVCAFVIHNYVNLNIGLKLTLLQAAAYFLEWTVVGIVIGLIYRG